MQSLVAHWQEYMTLAEMLTVRIGLYIMLLIGMTAIVYAEYLGWKHIVFAIREYQTRRPTTRGEAR